eukprot:4503915-Amphidinium_carterae.1
MFELFWAHFNNFGVWGALVGMESSNPSLSVQDPFWNMQLSQESDSTWSLNGMLHSGPPVTPKSTSHIPKSVFQTFLGWGLSCLHRDLYSRNKEYY